ncbi:MAG TPA: acetyl-CoA carboxylase biotin carboxylase subunit [Spirochaetes bacterium]|nr:acetyl-CoA carboxylase biotin carboxylase subunit [Spirochaetota bacterium]
MFKKILVANRGEIARRVMCTCLEMGIETTAVYSEADSVALHVLSADRAVCLGNSEPAESYLNIDKIIAAAKEARAEAVHPGYGFLSENPSFAERCEKEGLVFVGPPSRVIRELGDKTSARRIAIGAKVPVIPGMDRAASDPEELAAEAAAIGFPVLIKAAAGGGGKGMRVVSAPGELKEACVSASGEAKSAFGDGAIYLEKYLERPRHIEFQILSDTHGNHVHLFERECSIQRRHQKIIEETPSPVMTAELRKTMGEAATAMARAAGYVGAGTVEFLLDRDGCFYFLEVNTRLQVEHPVTEMTLGIDLVRLQLEIAAGGKLPFEQDKLFQRGHAIECRVYAEDPANGFFPSPGLIEYLREPSGPGVRVDSGIYEGFTVPVEYDPILSKLIVHAETREAAVERMLRALREYMVLGVQTPIPFLADVMGSEAFGAGMTYTDFIETHFAGWAPAAADLDLACAAYIVNDIAGGRAASPKQGPETAGLGPWMTLGPWGR